MLIATAFVADRRIISLNDRERRRFRRVAGEVTELRIVCWIDLNREDVPAWLRAGALERENLRLV